ncbi:MAG: hypothetical protein HN929_14310 [Chloroflexi bacterium]|nr:hypothetical protein [Chloroflexota bacterium]
MVTMTPEQETLFCGASKPSFTVFMESDDTDAVVIDGYGKKWLAIEETGDMEDAFEYAEQVSAMDSCCVAVFVTNDQMIRAYNCGGLYFKCSGLN